MVGLGSEQKPVLAHHSELGLGLACRAEQPERVEPRLVGQSPERGHLLRSGELLDSPISERRKAAVVIVGGGAAGLSAT